MSKIENNSGSNTSGPLIGPVACAVTIARDAEAVAMAYEQHLHLTIQQRYALDAETATGLGLNGMANQTAILLSGGSGRAWLLIVEKPDAPNRDALATHGWLAQEILVEDVDALAQGLSESPFFVLRPPADLDVSDRIRACQVRGPAGEILYLTQVKGEVPPFELPACNSAVDHLFIPVLSTPDRDATLAEYERLAGVEGLRFDTRITVVNQALGLPLEERHPVGTLQLADNALIEVDHIDAARPASDELRSGTVAIVFYASGAAPGGSSVPSRGPFAGKALLPSLGIAGERRVLLYEH